MEKGRVGNKRKRARTLNDELISDGLAKDMKKSFDKYEKDLNDVKAVVKNKPSKKKTIVCDRCKAAMELVKTNGSQEIYKCINCKRTTERWI